MSWDDASEKALAELWAAGWSASQIGARIGQSRNAVIGKVHRLKLPKRRTTSSQAGAKRQAAVSRAARPAVPGGRGAPARRHGNTGQTPGPSIVQRAEARAAEEARTRHRLAAGVWAPLEGRAPVAFLDLERGQCRWPLGDPREAGFGFCGLPVAGEKTSYCAVHHGVSVRQEAAGC